jgi:FkbM family methyltransferase
MHVEECCQALLSEMLPEVDRNRLGLAIDIGVGTFAFYCQLFNQLKFTTIAVEPLPINKLYKLCKNYNIRLIENCISDFDGLVNIYVGSYQDKENLNLNSMRSDWWGSTTNCKQVPSVSLANLLTNIDAHSITCMKIDVEGMEFCIIKQFLNLPDNLLPKVLMFEYGGGGTKESGKGGWSQEIFNETMESLAILKKLGFTQTIIVDSADGAKEQIFNLQLINLEHTAIFSPQSIYGNIITLSNIEYCENKINTICKLYQDNRSTPPHLQLSESLLSLTYRKIRQILLPSK